jgi:SAM-dependent methyltransferase
MIPLRLGSPSELATFRSLLRDAGYTEPSLCERYGLGALASFKTIRKGRPVAARVDHPLEVLTRLFLDGEYVTAAQLRSLWSAAPEILAAIGVAAPAPHNAELWSATVVLYPRGTLYIASDRTTNPDGSPFEEFDDIVYSALTDNTDRFLGLLPRDPCASFLDLGTGTGIAALIAGRAHAEHAWAVDITERAVQFSEFNRRLNDVPNVTVLRGDLCEPVADLTFDRIVIHPPYVPALRQRIVFQDAGLDGQEIVRRAVGQLARHLRPGGRFYCLSLGVDLQDEPFERSVRRWLGPAEAQFDVAFIARSEISPEFLARGTVIKASGGPRDLLRLGEFFTQRRVHEFVYGATIIERRAGPRPAFTVRRQRGPRTGQAEIGWLLAWENYLAGRPADSTWLLDARPTASPDLELRVLHRMQDGELAPAEFALQSEYPFSMEARASAAMATLAARCDGSTTGRELYVALREQHILPAHVTEADFAGLLASLVSGGFIELPEFPLPRKAVAPWV